MRIAAPVPPLSPEADAAFALGRNGVSKSLLSRGEIVQFKQSENGPDLVEVAVLDSAGKVLQKRDVPKSLQVPSGLLGSFPGDAANNTGAWRPGRAVPLDEPVKIMSHPGLGDVVITAAIGYAATEAGATVSLGCRDRDNGRHAVSHPQVADLPFLPLIEPPNEDAKEIGLDKSGVFEWRASDDIIKGCLDAMRVPWGTTPRVGALQPTEGDWPALAGERKGYKGYLVVAPDGNFFAVQKRLTDEQIGAAAKAARRAKLKVLIVGAKASARALPEGAIDLRGKTNLRQLCALVEHATALVSAESGPGHIAAGYWTPTLLVCPSQKMALGVPQYSPFLWLVAPCAGDVPARLVETETARLIAASLSPWCIVARRDGLTVPCGVAASAQRIAKAAGVPFRTMDDGAPDMPCVIDYHGLEGFQWREYWGTLTQPTVLSVHEANNVPPVFPLFARGKAWHNKLRGQGVECGYVPLPTYAEVPDAPTRPGLIATHGRPEAYHGYTLLHEAMEIVQEMVPHAEFRIVASQDGKAMAEEDMIAELAEAEVFVYPHTSNGDQSAGPPDVMAFGRPILVSDTTSHDDYRGWCTTVPLEAEQWARQIVKALHYPEYLSKRARMGGCYRSPRIVGKQYRAALLQHILDGGKP